MCYIGSSQNFILASPLNSKYLSHTNPRHFFFLCKAYNYTLVMKTECSYLYLTFYIGLAVTCRIRKTSLTFSLPLPIL